MGGWIYCPDDLFGRVKLRIDKKKKKKKKKQWLPKFSLFSVCVASSGTSGPTDLRRDLSLWVLHGREVWDGDAHMTDRQPCARDGSVLRHRVRPEVVAIYPPHARLPFGATQSRR
jgi:hypothetical protein